MNKKPSKVGEAAAKYTGKKTVAKAATYPKATAAGQVRYLDKETARKLTKDILDKHHDLFRKLAQ